jgi:hypothetical protein
MKVKADLILVIGLVIMSVGMALITFGVVVSGVFFAGVYLLAIGLAATAAGAILRLFYPSTP